MTGVRGLLLRTTPDGPQGIVACEPNAWARQARDRLVGREVALWLLDTGLDVIGSHPVDDALLDHAERSRAAGFVRETDRHRYRAAHVGLRVLLGGYLRVPPDRVEFVREDCPRCGGPHGRPAVAGGGVHFSLSHSGDVALLALAGVPVGVDVEAVPEPQAVTDLLAVLHPREADELRSLREAQRPDALARVWSRKEAYLKGTGEGLAFGFAHPYVGSAPEPAQLPGWKLRDAACPAGYAAALCVSTG